MKLKVLIISLVCAFAMSAGAKDIQVVVFDTNPVMHCVNCENKIKNELRFAKGVKEITTNLTDKTVTVKFDAEKTSIENLVGAFGRINYKATVKHHHKHDGKHDNGKHKGQKKHEGKHCDKHEGGCQSGDCRVDVKAGDCHVTVKVD